MTDSYCVIICVCVREKCTSVTSFNYARFPLSDETGRSLLLLCLFWGRLLRQMSFSPWQYQRLPSMDIDDYFSDKNKHTPLPWEDTWWVTSKVSPPPVAYLLLALPPLPIIRNYIVFNFPYFCLKKRTFSSFLNIGLRSDVCFITCEKF